MNVKEAKEAKEALAKRIAAELAVFTAASGLQVEYVTLEYTPSYDPSKNPPYYRVGLSVNFDD